MQGSVAVADSRIKVIGKRYADSHHAQLGGGDRVEVKPFEEQIVGNARRPLLILTLAVLLGRA